METRNENNVMKVDKNAATCISVSIYSENLTYGKKYVIIKSDVKKQQVKIKTDTGRISWFPNSCFDFSGANIPTVKSIIIDDVDCASAQSIEVKIELSNGDSRWCFFSTPDALKLFGDFLEGSNVRIHYGLNMIIVTQLNEDVIKDAIKYIESQGEILSYTLPVEYEE